MADIGNSLRRGRQNLQDRFFGKVVDFRSSPVSPRNVLSGSVLTSDSFRGKSRYILFASVLMVVYVAWGYCCEKTLRLRSDLLDTLKCRKIECLTRSSELMEVSKQSRVMRQVNINQIPISESKTPPFIIDAD